MNAPGPEMRLSVVHVASEVAPFSETGGLGVVAGALPSALANAGIRTSVITPCYRSIPKSLYRDTGASVHVTIGGRKARIDIMVGELEHGVPVYLLKCDEAYDRDGIYGPRPSTDFADNAWRYALLCEGALAVSRRLRLHPDIFHCHDWQTGLLPLICHERMGRWVRSIMTIHNLGYHGTFPADTVEELGLSRSQFHPGGIEFWGWLSFLKAGLVYAERLTTVSPTYAQEIQSARHGHGLDGVLSSRSADLVGILNGLPPQKPAADGTPVPPSADAMLEDKAQKRTALVEQMGLVDDDTPIFVVVSRLVSQKGIDLLPAAASNLLNAGAIRLAILGSGDAELEQTLVAMAQRWPDRVAVHIGYDESRSTLFLSGGDALLMPSRYEPCGLTQLFALRCGTLPVVRKTGGLADTVTDGESGFTFDEATSHAFAGAIDRARMTYKNDQSAWTRMQRAAMDADFSWNRSAQEYAELYTEVHDAA
ncbi:MAG: starch synthase [Myxococcota bacterium]|jgi:starch synthase